MWSAQHQRDVAGGYLFVVRFEPLFRSFAEKLKITRDWYAFPRIDRRPEDAAIRYRGLDRYWPPPHAMDSLAELHLEELESRGRAVDGIVFDIDDVRETFQFVEDDALEVVWTRECGASLQPPKGFTRAGIDATWFLGDHFSASCDCMMFPRWHGTDDEGTLFLEHFRHLNRHGLFDSKSDAEAFLHHYLSFPWTETGDYTFAEVFVTDALDPRAFA